MSAQQIADGGGDIGGRGSAGVVAPVRRTYTVPEACALLGISRQRAHRQLAEHGRLHDDIPCFKIGRRWQVQKLAVDRMLGIEAPS